jgi:tetratricopeptide (TPR) repeat protein
MAHLAAHPEPEVSVAAVFLIGRQPANSDSDAFYNYLIPQLAQIAGLTRIEIPSDIQGCIAQFKRLIDVAAAQTRLEGKRLVILVDGLDEDQSPYYTTKKQSVAASLPESLPPNVRVIISSRFNLLLPTDVPDIHPLRNSKFTHLLVQSELAKANRVAATKELEDILSYKDAQGIRYGRDMLAFMAASGGWLTAHDLKDLTHQDLYSINEILNKGATARTFGVMQSADGEQSYSLGHDLLDQLLVCNYLGKKIRYPLEQGTDTERVSDRARYQQQRFHTLKDWRHRIALWAEEYTKLKWPLSTTPDYLCSEFLAELLSNDPDLEESAIATLTDSSRIRLLRRKHGSNYQSISQLQTCIDIFAERVKTIQSRTLINLTTALHFLSKLSQRTHNIPSGLPAVFTLIGRHTYAVELALSVTNPLTRADALCRIATILAESGKINEAKRIAEYALSSANAITEANPRVKALVLADIATVLTKAGNTAKAFNIAKTIDDSYDKALIIAAMAITLEKSGKTDDAADFVKRALCIANTSSNSYEIVQILTDISTAFEKSGDTEEVFDIAEHALSNENISTNSFKKHLVSAVTDIALAKSSNTKKTTNINDFKLDTVDTIIHPYEKAQVLTDIATELATSGNIEEATDIAERALRAADTSTYQYEKEEKERILVDVATALAKSNNFEDAIKIANSITTPYEKDQVLADISIAIAKNGNSDRATRIAHTITEPSTKDQAHAGIAIALAESGNVEKATIISQTLTFPYAKDRYLSKTAIMLMKSSNIAKATNTANAITNPYTKDQVLADLVIILTNSCNINEATDTANTITDLYEKDRAFAAIAITHVKSGRTEEAKDIANTITDTYELVRVLAEIAVAVMKSGNTIDATKTIEHALSTADTYVVPFENGRALAAIVAILARSGHAEEANSIANTITDPYAKCQALVDVATGFAKSDNTEKAIEIAGDALIIADTITYPYSRPLVLGELAIGFSMPQLEAYRVKATVAMLLAAENPWSQFDVLLHVASAPALAILPLLLYEEEN